MARRSTVRRNGDSGRERQRESEGERERKKTFYINRLNKQAKKVIIIIIIKKKKNKGNYNLKKRKSLIDK